MTCCVPACRFNLPFWTQLKSDAQILLFGSATSVCRLSVPASDKSEVNQFVDQNHEVVWAAGQLVRSVSAVSAIYGCGWRLRSQFEALESL